MKLFINYHSLCWLFLIIFVVGCSEIQSNQSIAPIDVQSTIGDVSEIYYFEAIPLRGIGIVAGLHGTGSSQCPPRIRRELEKYIWKQVPADTLSPSQFINSKDTAVVEVFGIIPSLISGRETFDVAVRPLSGTETTSLDGGHLYTTELKELSRLTNIEQFTTFSKTFASVEGPIFSNKLNGEKENMWYVLGGAKILEEEKITLLLKEPDFLIANVIRNRINERFGEKTATAVSDAQIYLQIPSSYQKQKERFLKMVKTLLLSDNTNIMQERLDTLAFQLANDTDKESAEIALEAIGRPATDTLQKLLIHPDESVQFYAARCMLNCGDNRAIPVLREILLSPKNPFKLSAVEAIGQSANRSQSRSALMIAINDPDIEVRLAAYEFLLRINSPVVDRKIIAGSFVVDSVVSSSNPLIYIFQQQTPRIVLFGSPIYCEKNLFIQSDDGTIIVNANPGDKYISVARKHPERSRVIGPLETGFEVSHLLQTMGELPEPSLQTGLRPGLAIPYDEIISFLKKMCEMEAIKVDFIAGPPAKIDPMLQDLPPIGG